VFVHATILFTDREIDDELQRFIFAERIDIKKPQP